MLTFLNTAESITLANSDFHRPDSISLDTSGKKIAAFHFLSFAGILYQDFTHASWEPPNPNDLINNSSDDVMKKLGRCAQHKCQQLPATVVE